MNIFNRVVAKQRAGEHTLGNPLPDALARERRMNFMATVTGGKGFPVPATPPRVDSLGRTRGDRKRLAREAAIAKIKKERVYG